MAEEEVYEKIRRETRETKLRKKKEKMKQHGKGLGKIYRDAVGKKRRSRRASYGFSL